MVNTLQRVCGYETLKNRSRTRHIEERHNARVYKISIIKRFYLLKYISLTNRKRFHRCRCRIVMIVSSILQYQKVNQIYK